MAGTCSIAAPAALRAESGSDLSDEMVRSRVELQLRDDGRINWEKLSVVVAKGSVTLFGEVANPEEKDWAETIAGTDPGVLSVRNNVLVDSALMPDH